MMHPFLSGDPDKFLAEERSRAETAEKRNKARPRPRLNRSREAELMLSQMRVLSFQAEETCENNKFQKKLRNTWITGQCHCSSSLIEALQSINLREMMVPKIHTGRYLVCRTLCKIIVRVGASVLVEDLNGDVEDVSLYNFRYDLTDNSWLPEGSIMVIKEPYLKYGFNGDDSLICVDSPSDVEFVEEADYSRLECFDALKWYKQEKLDINQLKSEGNNQYRKKNFETALKYYNKALLLDPDSAVVRLNKAAALIATQRFYEAYIEAKFALSSDVNAEKSLYRLGIAAYGMRQWDKAGDHFQELLNRSPEHKEAKMELQRTTDRINESRTGKYNIHDLYSKTVKGSLRRLDIADYIGPVKVVDVPGKGKGVVATENIAKGTLIMAIKAFSAAFDEDFDGILYSVNLILKRFDNKTHVLNMIKTSEHLQKNPQLANELYSLYAGDMPRDQKIPTCVIDTARIQNICSYNWFGITHDIRTAEKLTRGSSEENQFDQPTGLWILPSFINHSCLQNANRTFYGDFMMLFAVLDITKGEEITVTYADPFDSYEKRREKLGKHFGFQCDCRLCKLDGADGDILAERQRLLSECNKFVGSREHVGMNSKQTVSRLISLTDQLRQTYKNRSEYRLDLVEPLSMLGTLYEMKGDYRNGIKCYEEAFECMGSGLRYAFGPNVLTHLAQDYLMLGQYRKAKVFMHQAMDMSKMKMGADEALFKELFSGLAEILY